MEKILTIYRFQMMKFYGEYKIIDFIIQIYIKAKIMKYLIIQYKQMNLFYKKKIKKEL